MQPADDDNSVEVVIISHRAGQANTESDEAIARALEEELAAAGGRGGSAWPGTPPASTGGSGSAPASVPATVEVQYVVSEPASLSQQAPVQQSAAWQDQLQQPPAVAAQASDDQLSEDERLARALHDQELRQLSDEQRDRLSVLPSLLGDSPLVRTLSERLLQGLDLTKLLPRVNSSIAAAGPPEPLSVGRARLDERLRLYCLLERQVKGDGACQFRALSDQLYRTPRLHGFVRECVCRQLAKHPERYENFVPQDYPRYCADMAKAHTWGDHVTLQAAADYFGLRILVVTSYESDAFLWIEPQEQRASRVLWLSFWAEVHYNSLYAADDPPPKLPTDKLLGSRRLHALLFGSQQGSM